MPETELYVGPVDETFRCGGCGAHGPLYAFGNLCKPCFEAGKPPMRLVSTQAVLWCVHVQGPDSVIPQPDRETAERRAEEWQAGIDKMLARDPSPLDPIKCVAAPWPWTAERHAEGLAEHGGEPKDIC